MIVRWRGFPHGLPMERRGLGNRIRVRSCTSRAISQETTRRGTLFCRQIVPSTVGFSWETWLLHITVVAEAHFIEEKRSSLHEGFSKSSWMFVSPQIASGGDGGARVGLQLVKEDRVSNRDLRTIVKQSDEEWP